MSRWIRLRREMAVAMKFILAMVLLNVFAATAEECRLPVEKPYLLFPVENANTPTTEKCHVNLCAANGDVLQSVNASPNRDWTAGRSVRQGRRTGERAFRRR